VNRDWRRRSCDGMKPFLRNEAPRQRRNVG
jgi:hypothetical protein